MAVLRHDKALHTIKIQPHLKDMPEYIIPESLKDKAEELAQKALKKKRKVVEKEVTAEEAFNPYGPKPLKKKKMSSGKLKRLVRSTLPDSISLAYLTLRFRSLFRFSTFFSDFEI